EHPDELLRHRPVLVVRRDRQIHPTDDADRVGHEEHESRDERGGAAGRQRAEPAERREGPADAEDRDQQGAGSEPLADHGAEPVPHSTREVPGEQRQSDEQPEDERADADQLSADLLVHVMSRSLYVGTRSYLSTPAQNCTSCSIPRAWSARPASDAVN